MVPVTRNEMVVEVAVGRSRKHRTNDERMEPQTKYMEYGIRVIREIRVIQVIQVIREIRVNYRGFPSASKLR
jgi:hypothetical protein